MQMRPIFVAIIVTIFVDPILVMIFVSIVVEDALSWLKPQAGVKYSPTKIVTMIATTMPASFEGSLISLKCQSHLK